jgi:hypothetical protein
VQDDYCLRKWNVMNGVDEIDDLEEGKGSLQILEKVMHAGEFEPEGDQLFELATLMLSQGTFAALSR